MGLYIGSSHSLYMHNNKEARNLSAQLAEQFQDHCIVMQKSFGFVGLADYLAVSTASKSPSQ